MKLSGGRGKIMPSIKHTHTYVKYKNRPGYFRCNDMKCTHFIDQERILGKLSKCNFCGNEFILTEEDLRRVRPRCLNCSNTKIAKRLAYNKAVASIIGETQAAVKVTDSDFNKPYNDEEDRF
jgi:hypothetical protein